MKTKTITLILILISILICSCSNKNKVIGCWETHHKEIIKFHKNGKFEKIDASKDYTATGTWNLNSNDRISYEYNYKGDNKYTTIHIVSINEQAMIIKYNGFLEFTWKKIECK